MAFSKKAAIGLLRRAHEQNRLGHAYLISGPIGSGKREVAAEVANASCIGDQLSTINYQPSRRRTHHRRVGQ